MFDKWKHKKEPLPQIEVITKWEKSTGDFYAPGALIRVKNGKKLLTEKFSEEAVKATYNTLMFRGQPLIQFQGEEYYCPTCEKIVRSGYQLEQTEEFHNELLNCEGVEFFKALDCIKPLLGLLCDNYYVVLDTELYPTDGNGHIFWNISNEEKALPGSCLFYMGEGEWGKSRPHFTVATQSIKKLNESRVDYYRKHLNSRAVAYYMDGYMTALLDGHHKTLAAVLEHKTVKALVIMPCYTMQVRQEDGQFQGYIHAGDLKFSMEMLHLEKMPPYSLERMSAEEAECIRNIIENTEADFPYNTEELVSYYPCVEEVACIDAAGEITNEYLERIFQENVICSNEEICVLMKALGALRHEQLVKMADFFLNKCTYISCMEYWNRDVLFTIVQQLVKLPRMEWLEEYLLELMVKYEDDYPGIKDMILDFL